MSSPTFSLGIDLGTSNSALAVMNLTEDEPSILELTQILGANSLGEASGLPSALYLPHPEEFPGEAFALPWEQTFPGIVGRFARDHGALVPDRLVTSAKSWLSNHHTDPRSKILLGAPKR